MYKYVNLHNLIKSERVTMLKIFFQDFNQLIKFINTKYKIFYEIGVFIQISILMYKILFNTSPNS